MIIFYVKNKYKQKYYQAYYYVHIYFLNRKLDYHYKHH